MNSPEWFYADLAAIHAGYENSTKLKNKPLFCFIHNSYYTKYFVNRGFAAGIYTTNSPEACLHCLKTSFANIVVVENDMQYQKILKIKDQAPDLKAIIQYSGKPNDPSVLSVSISRTNHFQIFPRYFKVRTA